MNKFAAAISLMMVTCVLMGEAMPNRRRSQGGAANAHGDHHVAESGTVISDHEKLSESLSAHERGLDELRALLQGESRRQNRLDRNHAQKNRRNKGRLYDFGDRIQTEYLLNFQTIDNHAEFSNLDANADVSSTNKFALSVVSEDSYDESASIKKNDGHQSQSGTKLQTHDIIDAETQLEENKFDQSDFLDTSNLSAAGASRDALNAEEASRVEQEAKLDAEREHKTSHDFQEGFFTGPNFGLGHGSSRSRNTGGTSGSSRGLFGGLSSGFGASSDLFGTGNLGHGSFSGLGGKLPF